MDAGDEAKRAVAAAFRECRKNALAKQAAGARSRFALRLMVEERLSHPLLEQMHTEDFAKNPLADDDMTDSAVELGQRLQVLQRELAAAAAAYDEVEDETPEWAAEEEAKEVDEEDEDDDAMADYEARFMAGGAASAPAATGALPPSSTAARDDGNGIEENALLDVSSSGLDDLVRLKAMVVEHDVTGSGLDATEFVAALGSMWNGAGHSELTRLFMQIDADSDGRARMPPPRMPPPRKPPPSAC